MITMITKWKSYKTRIL